MRTRLVIAILTPFTAIVLTLVIAFAWSVSRNVQQDFLHQQQGDVSYFATGARHALRTANPNIVEDEMRRYADLYAAQLAVVDRTGAMWVSVGMQEGVLDAGVDDVILPALTGSRTDSAEVFSPWGSRNVVVAEPVYNDGNVIGAVVISANADAPRGEILRYWLILLLVLIAVVLVLSLVVLRLTNWVLQPMERVDRAMAAIEHGDMDVRISDTTGPPEMRSMIRVFNGMADTIERVLSRQQEFVMNASHELRNPLGALLMRVEYLATGLGPEWDPEVEQTREEGRRMRRILDTLLLMARSGMKDSPFAPVNLVEVVADRLEAWRAKASSTGVSFKLSAPESLVTVTDRTAIESAFDAVLDNALKFSPRESSIEVTIEREGEDVMTIRDYGPGLSPEDIEHSTARFWRSPRDQNVPGSGLGLAIATDLLTEIGGRVHVSRAEGAGLQVSLFVPIALEEGVHGDRSDTEIRRTELQRPVSRRSARARSGRSRIERNRHDT